ncbi:MAG: putative addiction module antidote protein [Rhizobiaceae bacterium]|nr:putative addiction module antidote protein [Rhizobiaceae bacterium]
MDKLKTTRFDVTEFLKDEEMITLFLEEAFATGDPAYIAKALGAVARARNMTKLAAEAGMSRTSLYKVLSGEGRPEFGSIVKIASALGYRVTVTPQVDEAA